MFSPGRDWEQESFALGRSVGDQQHAGTPRQSGIPRLARKELHLSECCGAVAQV